MRKWNVRSRLHSTKSRNLAIATDTIERIADKLNVPRNVREMAAYYYRRTLSTGMVRGRSLEAVAAASLYLACRLTRVPRSLKELATASVRSKNEIARSYRLLLLEVHPTVPLDEPQKYLSKIASKLDVAQSIQNSVAAILREGKAKRIIAGKNPIGLAAAALYLASLHQGRKITQQALAEVSGVTQVTVRNRYKEILRRLT